MNLVCNWAPAFLLILSAGCTAAPTPRGDSAIAIDGVVLSTDAVDRYLASTLGFTSKGPEMKCAHSVIGRAGKRVFLETLCLEFVRLGDSVANASGRAGPVALTLEKAGDSLTIVSHEVPIDGGGHAESIRRIFPEDVAGRVLRSNPGLVRDSMFTILKAEAESRLLRGSRGGATG